MRYLIIGFLLLSILSCKRSVPTQSVLDAQEIVDRSIELSGGVRYESNKVSYVFRDRTYTSENANGRKILKRITPTDSIVITDVLSSKGFQRFFNNSLIVLPDTLTNNYANSVNSVHYFSRLPYGLNDTAVNKELLGETTIKGTDYYKIKVTFDQENGGKDFEDVFLYWFNKNTFKPDYLAYKYYTDGGGLRFREAFNERDVEGIRFVDYNNFKPKSKNVDFYQIERLFEKGELELLSKIELKQIMVAPSD